MAARLMTIDEAAEKLGLHPKTVRRLLREGKLSGRKVGGRWRVPENALPDASSPEPPSDPSGGHAENTQVFERASKSRLEGIRVSAVVDMAVADAEAAERLTSSLIAVMNSDDQRVAGARLSSTYDPERETLRLLLWGGPEFVRTMLETIQMYAEAHADAAGEETPAITERGGLP